MTVTEGKARVQIKEQKDNGLRPILPPPAPRSQQSDEERIAESLKLLAVIIHADNKKWWTDIDTGLPKDRNRGEMIALMHSELSEAMEGERKSLMDDKLPHRPMPEVEMADAVIRIFDYCEGLGYDLAGAILEKMEYNRHREDHKIENRRGKHGKKF